MKGNFPTGKFQAIQTPFYYYDTDLLRETKEYNVKEYIGTIDFERKSDGLSIFVDICSGSVKSINPKKIIELVESLGDLSGIEYDLIKLETYHIDEDTGKKSNIM